MQNLEKHLEKSFFNFFNGSNKLLAIGLEKMNLKQTETGLTLNLSVKNPRLLVARKGELLNNISKHLSHAAGRSVSVEVI